MQKNHRFSFLVTAYFFAAIPSFVHGGRVERRSFETEHFILFVDSRKTDLLSKWGGMFERFLKIQSKFFNYTPDRKIEVVFVDEDDIANGAAFSAQGWVVIYLPKADIKLRGRTRWLPNVIAHELAHIITLRKMGERRRYLGMGVFGGWEWGTASRGDAGLSVPHYNTPVWLAEGLAQYGSMICGWDTLDTHRNMVLRGAAAQGDLLDLKNMSAFAGDIRRNEMVYTQGFSLVSYLYETYGRNQVNIMMEETQKKNLKKAFLIAFDQSLETVYTQWKNQLQSSETASGRERPSIEAIHLSRVPAHSSYLEESSPIPFPNGSVIALSSRSNEFGVLDLVRIENGTYETLAKGEIKKIESHPNGKKLLVIAPRTHANRGHYWNRLYEYDLGMDKKIYYPQSQRVYSAAYGSDGAVYGVKEEAGKTVFGKWSGSGFNEIPIVFPEGDILEITGGRDRALLVEVVRGRGGDIARLDPKTGKVELLVASDFDERDPFFNSEELFFASDYNGKFDIYSLRGDSLFQWTDVSGGAFEPSIQNGQLYYSEYGIRGFLISSRPLGSPLRYVEPKPWKGVPTPVRPLPESAPFKKKPGGDGLKFLGYGFSVGLTHTTYNEIRGIINQDTSSGIVIASGGATYLSAGGEMLWLNPSMEDGFFIQAALAKEMQMVERGTLLLQRLGALYFTRTFYPYLQAQFNLRSLELPFDSSDMVLEITLLNLQGSGFIPMGNYWGISSFADYSGIILREEGDFFPTEGGGTALGQTIGFSDGNPGEDIPLYGLQLVLGGAYLPGASSSLQWVQFAHGRWGHHLWRTIFPMVSLGQEFWPATGESGSAEIAGAMAFRVPINWTAGSHINLKTAFPYFGAGGAVTFGDSVLNNSSSFRNGPYGTEANPHSFLEPALPVGLLETESPVYQFGLSIKVITFYNYIGW